MEKSAEIENVRKTLKYALDCMSNAEIDSSDEDQPAIKAEVYDTLETTCEIIDHFLTIVKIVD